MFEGKKWWVGNCEDPFETQAEREERLAAMSGETVRETAPEDIDEEPEAPCKCGYKFCGECMGRNYR